MRQTHSFTKEAIPLDIMAINYIFAQFDQEL